MLPPTSPKSSPVTSSRIRTPVLIVMLGSTPGKAGVELCRHMLTLSPADCRRVALVQIDTADEANELMVFFKEYENLFRFRRLRIHVPVTISYAQRALQPMHTYMPSKIPQAFANGAGGIRNNGHVAAAFCHSSIRQTLDAALQHLELLGTAQREQQVREVHVNIIAFLGGGTGSGILPDVAVMVRQLLLERLYEQRINLFCILPDRIQGTQGSDINWRKSNTIACLLELIALSLAANTTSNQIYKKYMLNDAYDLSADAIANEVYLIGRTAMGTADDTARIVGLDLFQRITDASGVGALERDTWSNRRSLGATDDRGLPTMFATSCPLEVSFPSQETATAFSQIAASYLLPKLVGMEPSQPDIDQETREVWREEWREVAILTYGTQGKLLAVRPADEFSVSEFLDASVETLDSLWGEVQRRRKNTVQKIESAIYKKRREEIEIINQVPADANRRISPITRQINHLHLLREEYTTVITTLKSFTPLGVLEQPQPRHSFLYIVPLVGRSLKLRDAQALCNDYNYALSSHAETVRYNLLLQTAEELLKRVEVLLQDKLKWYRFREDDLKRTCKELLTAGMRNAAWSAKLEAQHPHQRHIFDLESLSVNKKGQRSQAVERLFMVTTFSALEDAPTVSTLYTNQDLRFDSQTVSTQIDRFIDKCTFYLNNGTFDSDDAVPSMEDMTLQSREQFADRVVKFFYTHYVGAFQMMNLFQLLRIGTGSDNETPVGPYLLEHLIHMKGLVRDLITFQETLWHEGPERLAPSVFLGMSWENGQQKRELEQALNMLGSLTPRNQTPEIKFDNDPHRLQVAYGQHGISLATIPEFFRDTNSSMGEYIRHQGEWYGHQQPHFLPHPSPSSYGTNKMPVHSCGELERLVCDPNALSYQPNEPHVRRYTTNLIGRVIREVEGVIDRPDWSPNGSQGYTNPTGPANPVVPISPLWGNPTPGPANPVVPISPLGPNNPVAPTVPSGPPGLNTPPGSANPVAPTSPPGLNNPAAPANPVGPVHPVAPTNSPRPNTQSRPGNPQRPSVNPQRMNVPSRPSSGASGPQQRPGGSPGGPNSTRPSTS